MDSDDIWMNNKIKQLEYINEKKLDVIGSDIQLINENGKKVGIRKYSKVLRLTYYFKAAYVTHQYFYESQY